MTHLIAMKGDGIGPEIMDATLEMLEEVSDIYSLGIHVDVADIGFASLERNGTTISDALIERVRAADGALLGPVSHNDYPPLDQGGRNPSGVLRKALDLYANIRPARTRAGLPRPVNREFDLLIVRENTEGFYADRTMVAGTGEFMPTPDLAMALRKITAQGSRRIAEQAFRLARRRRKKVTAVHKANVLRISDGLYLEQARAVAAENPDIAYDEQLVDSMTALLIRKPQAFDVVLAPNMYGDILSDEASELAGGLGLAASVNIGDHHAIAQAQHGSAPDIAGTGRANPVSLMGSAAMLLAWIAERQSCPRFAQAGSAVEAAIDAALATPSERTADLGGSLGTKAFTDVVIRRIREKGGHPEQEPPGLPAH